MYLRVGRELSFFKKFRSNPVFIASIKVFQQLISFKWFQRIKYVLNILTGENISVPLSTPPHRPHLVLWIGPLGNLLHCIWEYSHFQSEILIVPGSKDLMAIELANWRAQTPRMISEQQARSYL